MFLAYACRTHTSLRPRHGCGGIGTSSASSFDENSDNDDLIVIQGLPPARSETVALVCAILVCVMLLLHRLYWGDDYGIAYSALETMDEYERLSGGDGHGGGTGSGAHAIERRRLMSSISGRNGMQETKPLR